jgi:hypothetical protein
MSYEYRVKEETNKEGEVIYLPQQRLKGIGKIFGWHPVMPYQHDGRKEIVFNFRDITCDNTTPLTLEEAIIIIKRRKGGVRYATTD